MRPIVYILCCAVGLVLAACRGVSVPEEEVQQKLVIALFSPGGLGDRGYNDRILYGLQRVHKTRTDCAMLLESPETMAEAEQIFSEWLKKKSSGIPCLFILASVEYEEMAVRILESTEADMTNKSILIFETGSQLPYPKVYTFRINMYGASYMAGVMAAVMGVKNPIVMLGSEEDKSIRYASDGFIDGYRDETGCTAELDFFSADWHGFAMSQAAYERMPELCAEHDFIYPVAGGTNLGIYRYLREHPDGPYVAGMDIDQSPFCNNIVGSMIKNIDILIEDGVSGWLDAPLSDIQHMEFGLSSGYVDWQIADHYARYTPIVEARRAQAIKREEEHQ